jgi:hypothetical protein
MLSGANQPIMQSVVMLIVAMLNVVAPISPLAFLISNMFRWPARVFMSFKPISISQILE